MKLIAFWVLLLLPGIAAAQVIPASVCDVLQSPAAFDGKMVRIRATVDSGFEVFGIVDPVQKCGVIWLTYPGGGPTASVSMGAKTPDLERTPIELKNDGEMKHFQKLLSAEMHPRERGSICQACTRYEVTATFTGRIDYAGKGRGFGHMNGYAARLVLQSVSDVSAVDLSSNYDPNEYSPTEVKFPTGILKGRIIAPDGRPVANAEVNATSTEDVPLYMHNFEESTDEKGRFKIAVPPGTYLLGINIRWPPSARFPFPPTYYPGTVELKAASKLSVADHQTLSRLEIRIPERLHKRVVPVKVTWPDGTPVEFANVWLAELKRPTRVVGNSVSHTRNDGTFDLIGFEGIDYYIHAGIYIKPHFEPHCAEKKTLKAEDAIPDRIVMVFTRTGDVCRGDH